jgi:hypothetical protein
VTHVILVTVFAIAASAAPAAGQKGHDSHQKGAKHESAAAQGTAVEVRFSSGDQRMIREYYAPRYRSLPPGLQKKIARGGQLPPGWQKKLEPFPIELERRLEPLPTGYGRGVIDGHAVIYNTRKSVVIDVAVLF